MKADDPSRRAASHNEHGTSQREGRWAAWAQAILTRGEVSWRFAQRAWSCGGAGSGVRQSDRPFCSLKFTHRRWDNDLPVPADPP